MSDAPTEHKRIYLEPQCRDCSGGPRMWCEDDQGPCECGAEWIAYDLATTTRAPCLALPHPSRRTL